MLGQHIRFFFFARRRLHCDAGLARNDVKMQVEDHLTASALIKLLDGDAVSRKCLDRRFGDLLRRRDHMREVVGADLR